MPTLRLIEGGRSLVTVKASEHDGLHLELVTARAERLTHATEAQRQLRAAMRHLAHRDEDDRPAPRLAAAGTSMLEALRIVEAEAERATAMDQPCSCGLAGPGHGTADSDALDVPLERAA